MATDVISLTPVSISGISKVTALGKDDGTVVFGAKNSSDSSISLYEFEYFTIH